MGPVERFTTFKWFERSLVILPIVTSLAVGFLAINSEPSIYNLNDPIKLMQLVGFFEEMAIIPWACTAMVSLGKWLLLRSQASQFGTPTDVLGWPV